MFDARSSSGGVVVHGGLRAPSEHDLRLSNVARHLTVPKPIVPRLLRPGRPDHRRRLQTAIQTTDVPQRLGDVDVAHDRENRRRRPVEVPVEANEIVAREPPKAGFPADPPASHPMPIVKQLEQRFGRDGGGIVGLSFRLLDDHLELTRELAGVDHRVRVRVGLDLQARDQPGRRQHRVVHRVVVDRAGVEIAAASLRFLGDDANAARRRPLEVHVLEHVGDADDVVGLVEVPRLHVCDDRDDGCRVVSAHENGQPVRQDLALHRSGVHRNRAGDDRGHGRKGRRRRRTIAATIQATPNPAGQAIARGSMNRPRANASRSVTSTWAGGSTN